MSSYGVGYYTGNNSAEQTYRDLYEAQWQDYQDRFLPYQDKLIDAATSVDMLDEQLSRISATTQKSKALSAQAANIARGRMGMQQSAGQQQQFNSQLNLNSALGQAGAENAARTAAYDNYQSAMTGAANAAGQLK